MGVSMPLNTMVTETTQFHTLTPFSWVTYVSQAQQLNKTTVVDHFKRLHFVTAGEQLTSSNTKLSIFFFSFSSDKLRQQFSTKTCCVTVLCAGYFYLLLQIALALKQQFEVSYFIKRFEQLSRKRSVVELLQISSLLLQLLQLLPHCFYVISAPLFIFSALTEVKILQNVCIWSDVVKGAKNATLIKNKYSKRGFLL